MALLLATLEENPVRLLHGRWLPPRLLATLSERMGLVQPDSRPGRSERGIPYLAFVHYLAQAADLASGTDRLGLTALAWRWLAATAATRWQMLWQGWLSAPAEVATPFRFAWSLLGPSERALVLDAVRRVPLERFVPLRQVVSQAHLHDEWGRLAQSLEPDGDVAAAVILEPLHWFGIVAIGEKSGAKLAAAGPRPEQTAPVPDLLLRLTPLGAWLLELQDFGPPAFAAPEPCTVRRPNYDQILVPPASQPLHLARLARLCHWQPPAAPVPAQRLLLARERVGPAVASGLPLAQLFHHVEAALGRPPSRRQQQRLRRWAAAGQQLRVRHVTLLETAEPQLMGRLRSRKLIRRHLGQALSPARVELNPEGIPALLKTLAGMELYAALPPELTATLSPRAADKAAPAIVLSAGDAALLLAAAEVYTRLGAHARLPLSIPTATVQTLAEQLAPAQQEAAEQAARHVLEQLEAALQGYLALPAWHFAREVERTVPFLEAAVAERDDLVITYQGAVREQVTVRRVTPYWLETRHQVLYLNAYCHLRQAERIFRVDRIIKCQTVTKGEEEIFSC